MPVINKNRYHTMQSEIPVKEMEINLQQGTGWGGDGVVLFYIISSYLETGGAACGGHRTHTPGKGDSGHGGCGSIRQLAGVSTVWECACILCIPAASMQCSRSPSVSQKRRTRMQTRN